MPTKKSGSTSQRRPSIDALAVAALWARKNTQTTIATTLGMKQATVSRLLKKAKDYVHEDIQRTFSWDKLDDVTARQVQKLISPREIGERIARFAEQNGRPAPKVHVATLDSGGAIAANFEVFASHASIILRDLLEDVRGRVGVAWGSTLWYTTQALREVLTQRPLRRREPIEFFPLCGDPLIDSDGGYADRTSSRIVADLSKAVNGDKPPAPWLGLVPAFIPVEVENKKKKKTSAPKIGAIDRLIDLVPQYGRIFGARDPKARSTSQSPPIAGDLDMIITAAGTAEWPWGFGTTRLVGLSEDRLKRLSENIYGDIGGVLLPRVSGPSGKGDLKPKAPALVDEIAQRWTGLRFEHLEACADRSFREKNKSRPGVTLLSFRSSHAEIVLEAIRQGLVNQLIIGSDLEEALSKALPSMAQR